jgi:hypothetical protein
MEQDSTKNLGNERRHLLATLIEKELVEKAKSSVVFDLQDLQAYPLLNDPNELVRALDRLTEDLKPDFGYHLNQFVARRQNDRYKGSSQGLKITVDNLSKLKDCLLIPAKKPALGFDPNKSRFYVRGKEMPIQKFSDQYHTLRIIFEDPHEISKEWFFSEIQEKVDKHKQNDKTYYNAINQIRIKLNAAGFPEFFKTTRQSVKINTEYLS